MFVYYFTDGETIKTEKGLKLSDILKEKKEHGELKKVKEIKEKPNSRKTQCL